MSKSSALHPPLKTKVLFRHVRPKDELEIVAEAKRTVALATAVEDETLQKAINIISNHLCDPQSVGPSLRKQTERFNEGLHVIIRELQERMNDPFPF